MQSFRSLLFFGGWWPGPVEKACSLFAVFYYSVAGGPAPLKGSVFFQSFIYAAFSQLPPLKRFTLTCKAMQSYAKQCKAMQSYAKLCKSMQSNAKQCKAMHNATQCKAMQSKSRHSNAQQCQSTARQGVTCDTSRPSTAKRCM